MLCTKRALRSGKVRLSPAFAPAASSSSSLVRRFSTTKRIHFDPKNIIPHEYGHVRVISNTTRDAQQSNCSAEMADEHRQQITKLIDDVYKPTTLSGLAPGYEQIWGGTIPMFDIWKRGVSPFDSLRQQVAAMPHTPSSMLFRSSAITSMSNMAPDVIDAFIKNSCEAGMNVYTNFDAHNDPRNHQLVAESVLKHGGHYQAALSWAVYNADPSIYNVQWVVDFFRECVDMGAHSLYIKDPSGVLTPEMAACISRQVKEAFPSLPLVYHTHYQTGYGYMTYLEAVKNGANGVECSIGFPDGAGQPYSLTMLRVFEDLGFHTGDPSKSAMTTISDLSKKLRPLYKQANVVRTPDISVEESGIAGGQRSILDKELMDVNQGHLIPLVDTEVANVRAEGGKVCQVTPVADTYAREAMRRLRGGAPDRNFVPGFAGILVGEGGLVKEPVNPVKQRRALQERTHQLAAELVAAGALTGSAKLAVGDAGSKAIQDLVAVMQSLASPTVTSQRIKEVTVRVSQLETIMTKPDLLASLDRKFQRLVQQHEQRRMEEDKAAQEGGDAETATTDAGSGVSSASPSFVCSSTAEKLSMLKQELAALQADTFGTFGAKRSDLPVLDQAGYEGLLKGDGKSPHVDAVLNVLPQWQQYVAGNFVTKLAFAQLLARAGFLTCAQTDLLAPALASSKAALLKLEREEVLGITESEELFNDLVILHACFHKAAIPNLFINFLRHYRENKAFWPALFTGHVRSQLIKAPSLIGATTESTNSSSNQHLVSRGMAVAGTTKDAAAKFAKTDMHLEVEKFIGEVNLKDMVALNKEVQALRDRLHSQGALQAQFDGEEKDDPAVFRRRLAPGTVKELKTRMLQSEATLHEKIGKVGLSSHYDYLVEDLIRHAE